jgi:hypothetical protein
MHFALQIAHDRFRGVNPGFPPARISYREPQYLVSSETGAELRASDAALIERIMQRDEIALEALYDRYAGMLSSILNRILRDTQAAEEILQDIFFSSGGCGAVRRIPGFTRGVADGDRTEPRHLAASAP